MYCERKLEMIKVKAERSNLVILLLAVFLSYSFNSHDRHTTAAIGGCAGKHRTIFKHLQTIAILKK